MRVGFTERKMMVKTSSKGAGTPAVVRTHQTELLSYRRRQGPGKPAA